MSDPAARITREDIDVLAAWLFKLYPNDPPIPAMLWYEMFSAFQRRHFRYALELLDHARPVRKPDVSDFALCCLMIGTDLEIASMVYVGGLKAWKQYLVDMCTADERVKQRAATTEDLVQRALL